MKYFNGVPCTESEFKESERKVRSLINEFLNSLNTAPNLSNLDKEVINYFKASNDVGLQKLNLNNLI